MDIIAIIPARAGSRRIPRKNVKPFHGRPIIAYSIATAKLAGIFDRVYVSTDDPMIGMVARQMDATPVMRPAELARDEVGTQEVARSVLLALPDVRYACCIYPCAPLMAAEDLLRGFRIVAGGSDLAYGTAPDGSDAGQFYWGWRHAFMDRIDPHQVGVKVGIPLNRVCDINTPEDWSRAEQLYEQLRRK